ncbi:hypothetical protein D3C80_2104790 [compost metagenome]
MLSVQSMEIANGTGIRLRIDAASVQPGLVLEGELLVKMTESGGKLLRPVIGVRISDAIGAVE